MSKDKTSRIRRESVTPQSVSWEYETPLSARRRSDPPSPTSVPPMASVDDDTQEMAGLGRFGWAIDPDGNRFELWEPAPGC